MTAMFWGLVVYPSWISNQMPTRNVSTLRDANGNTNIADHPFIPGTDIFNDEIDLPIGDNISGITNFM
jgi:hypothetical protein